MKILVTGGAGFIGSHIVDDYIREGHEVFVLDNMSSGQYQNLNPQSHLFKLDITADLDLFFATEKFDAVNHHAAQIDVRKSVLDPKFDAQTNLIGTLNLLENSVKYGVKYFIFASSGGAVYGEQEYFPADEIHPTHPISQYGVSKLSAEQYLYCYQKLYGLKTLILRYSNVYGPRQNSQGEAGVVSIFTTKLINRQQPIIYGSGLQTRDYVYVGDVARANVKALNFLKLNSEPNIFNISTNLETDVNTLFEKIGMVVSSTISKQHGSGRKGETHRSLLSPQLAYLYLDWKPLMSLEEGLKRTATYFKSAQTQATMSHCLNCGNSLASGWCSTCGKFCRWP